MIGRLKLAAGIGTLALILALAIALVATRTTLADARAQFEQWKLAVAHAQADATARALAAKIERERHEANVARTAQADYDALRERYAGLLRAEAAGRASRSTNMPRASEAAGVLGDAAEDTVVPARTGTGVPAGTILIAQADALICAENTAYAQAAHGWAIKIQ